MSWAKRLLLKTARATLLTGKLSFDFLTASCTLLQSHAIVGTLLSQKFSNDFPHQATKYQNYFIPVTPKVGKSRLQDCLGLKYFSSFFFFFFLSNRTFSSDKIRGRTDSFPTHWVHFLLKDWHCWELVSGNFSNTTWILKRVWKPLSGLPSVSVGSTS